MHAFNGSVPHESYGGWEEFLKTCEVREEVDGVIFFGRVNCNYIVWPNGCIIQNFGYHGHALMNEIREKGKDEVMQELEKNRTKLLEILHQKDIIDVASKC